MASTALLNHAARIVRDVQSGIPADAALRDALKRDRHTSSPPARRDLTRAVFGYFRWWRWVEPQQSLQKQLEKTQALQARFEQAPATFKAEALAARAVPEWFCQEVDCTNPALFQQMQREAPLWIRVQQGKQHDVLAELERCRPAEHPALTAPTTAFRYEGTRDLFLSAAFRDGLLEIQDLASQLVGHACAPQPGQTWWDACAGEGGKTLHLSDLMQNKGTVWASDRSRRRLEQMKKRAARARVFNYRVESWEGGAKLPTRTKFDGVLIDAPCSGTGTWQRNPHARWTTQPADVAELALVQRKLLENASAALKSGGRLVYSVCTLTKSETTAVAQAFTEEHSEFEPTAVFPVENLASGAQLFLWPHEIDANGMFIAAWKKR